MNHINGNKWDNRPCNLEWFTRRDNLLHSYDIGLRKRGDESHLCHKLSEDDVRKMKALKGKIPNTHIARQFGISPTYVGKIITNKKWRQIA